MNRKIRSLFQWTLVVTLTTLLSASPVSAGWLHHHLRCKHQANYDYVSPDPCRSQPIPVCPPPVPRCCPAPIDCCGVASLAAPVIDNSCICGCGANVSSTPMIESAPMAVEPMIDGHSGDSVIEIAPVEQPFDPGPIESPSDNNAIAPVPPVPDEVVEPSEEEALEPTPEPEETPEPTPEPSPDVAPEADVAPPAEAPTEDLFAVPPTDPPATDPPAEDPPIDDLFGDPPASDAPAEEKSIDDLFGDDTSTEGGDASNGAATESLIEMPDEPAAEAAVEAQPEPASDGLDDIFGSDAEAEAADAEPADEQEAPEAGSEPESTENTIDDLFGDTPSETDASEESESTVDSKTIDDLFGAASATAADVVESVAELPAPRVATTSAAPVTVIAVETAQVDPLSNSHVRTWIDNTGLFSTKGRLIEINRTNVRLMKPNGRTCTVPHSRLSEADAAYVDSISKQQQAPLVAMVTQS